MSVNITVVTCNRLNLTKVCLSSLLGNTRGDFVVQVVDNGSGDGTAEWLRRLARDDSRVRAHFLGANRGVAVAANFGWAEGDAAGADYYLKLDNDIEILRPDWLTELVRTADACPDMGPVGYQFLSRIATRTIDLNGEAFRASACCGGACVLVPRAAHAILGFWNEDYGRYGFEDLEYSMRATLAGLRVGYLDRDDMARHLGYEMEWEQAYEQGKKSSVTHERSGEKLFVINQLLFEDGVRPLYVSRRFLPEKRGGAMVFRLDARYKAILALQRDMLAKTDFEADGETIKLDLRAFRHASSS